LQPRQKQLSHAGWALFESWLDEQAGLFEVQPSAATSLAFTHYRLPLSSFELAERIRQEASVLGAPGRTMGAEQHLRLTLGYEPEKIRAALRRVGAVVGRIRSE
jgi:aspartate/methionine/tyrosine aminotransferase